MGEQLDFPRLEKLNAVWRVTPPLYVATAGIAHYLGVKFREPPAATPRIATAPAGEAGEVLDMLIADAPR